MKIRPTVPEPPVSDLFGCDFSSSVPSLKYIGDIA